MGKYNSIMKLLGNIHQMKANLKKYRPNPHPQVLAVIFSPSGALEQMNPARPIVWKAFKRNRRCFVH